MSELQWKKRDFSTGAISFDSHDSEYILNPYDPHKILRA